METSSMRIGEAVFSSGLRNSLRHTYQVETFGQLDEGHLSLEELHFCDSEVIEGRIPGT
jgi:hypothetical protein